MSRIEEALKKAREEQDRSPASSLDRPALPGEPAAVPSPALFDAPWIFADAPERAAADGGREAPAGGIVRGAVHAGERSQSIVQGPWHGTSEEATAPGAAGSLGVFKGFAPEVAERIVVTSGMRGEIVEQYRKLAGYLHHVQIERGVKVVMVTSAIPSEGKTLTTTNLALTLSESYHRSVLLVDADLRRPSMHDIFKVPNVSGLGDGLRAGPDQRLALVQVSPRLMLLPAGRPDADPMAGLTSERMQQILTEASASFDWVLIDTPPVGLLPDAKILAGMADCALLVVHAGKTPHALVTRAVEAVGRERILGVVLNHAQVGITGNSEYAGYYERYGRKSSKNEKR
jgi:protein-tyrosine kinase